VALVHQGRPGETTNRIGHALLGIVEPLVDESLHGGPPVPAAHLLEPPLSHAGRADAGEVVPVPLGRHANAALHHAHEVPHVLVVPLYAHRREDQGTFLVHVLGDGHVGRRQTVAAIGLMGLATAVNMCSPSKKTGTMKAWSAAWVLPE